MDISKLKRSPSRIHEALEEINDQLVATKALKIYIPEHYSGTPLGNISNGILIVAIYGITVEDKYYASSKACALIELSPSVTDIVDVNDVKYLEFVFLPGDVVSPNINLIKSKTLIYRIYNEIISKGKVPWYLNHSDLCQLFNTATLHGGGNLGVDSAILELIAASIVRNSKDKHKFYRHNPVGEPAFVSLSSVGYGASNTTAKLSGNHFAEGVTSALTVRSVRNEIIEDLLRK